jgi:peptide/nickel transport system permease protein
MTFTTHDDPATFGANTLEVANDPPKRGTTFRRFARNKAGMAGLIFLLLLVAIALLAPVLAPNDPDAQHLLNRLQPPNQDFLLGTDQFGRDQLSRLIYGARVSLMVGVGAMTIAVLIGVPLGLLAGFVGKRLDTLLSRFYDAVVALPALLFFFVVIAVFGHGLTVLFVTIGVVSSTVFFRISRAQTQSVAQETYIEASRALGASTRRIVVHHILPNILSPLLVRVSLGAGAAVTAEASLSFLGLGVVPPTPSWGGMLSAGNEVVREAPFLVYAPGVMIALTVLAFSLVGEGLRSAVGTTRGAVAEKS